MRALALIAALALLPLAAAPSAEAKRPKRAKCAAAKKKPRKCARMRGVRLRSTSYTALLGIPGGFATPTPFATSPPPAGQGTPSPGAGQDPVEPPELPPVYSDPRAVQVQAFEFGLQLSKSAVSSGNVRVEFNSMRAEDPHDLNLVREDGSGALYQFDEQGPGGVATRTVALTSGRWKLFCSLTGHEAAGMKATLTVNAG